jgi:SNF2 family DNA or RNA helicase
MNFSSIIRKSFIAKIAQSMQALPHQERVLEKLKSNKGVLVYHGLGSGKTFAAINSAKELQLPILAITPASLRENFKKEIQKSGFTGQYRVVSYEEAVKQSQDPEFLDYASKAMVIYDEAHRMGREDSQRSKLPGVIPSNKTMLLTGTPIRNRPTELVPLLKAIGVENVPTSAGDFKDRFVGQEMEMPGFFGTITGAGPVMKTKAKNLSLLTKYIAGKVDYYESSDKDEYPEVTEETIKVPMTPKQDVTYKMMTSANPSLAYKVQYGIPPDKTEVSKMQSFLIGPRLIANTPVEYNAQATDEDAAKITRAVDEIEKRYKEDPNFRGVSYSAFLSSGINPLSRELDRRSIPHIKFTGELNDKQKKDAIEQYNSGQQPVLLISGAGAEGLDLKGTKLMQVLEPHWNEELIEQVKGRAIRYKSHTHLDPEERNVTVQKFQATLRPSIKDTLKTKLYQIAGMDPPNNYSADEYLDNMSKEKRELNTAFLEAMKEVGM